MRSNERQRSTQILADLVTSLEPRLRPLLPWYNALVETIDKWSASEGNQGVKRAKDALGQGWLAILGEPVTQLDYVKTESGVPTLVKPLVDRVKALRPDPRLLSAVLSWVRVTDLWEGQPQDSTIEDSLRVINDAMVPSTAKAIIDEFSDFVGIFLRTHPNHPLAKGWNQPLSLGRATETRVTFYSESVGPNGPLTAAAHLDVASAARYVCSDGKSLLEHQNQLMHEIVSRARGSWSPNTRFADSLRDSGFFETANAAECPGKLSFVSDKSGKLRVIAEPDWLTQYSLRPIHSYLMGILKGVPEDATFDQGSALPKIGAWENEGAYLASFDQSSCTDLFPFDLQLTLLAQLQCPSLAESVKAVMADRDWEIRLPKSRKTKRVRWKAGQPLGAYASWPLMALTHHFLVQYAHWRSIGRRASWEPFSKYVICGDDIVIADRRVADSYRKVVARLGMKINLSKSHISGRGTSVDPVAEFTKVIVWKGQPLFPIRPKKVLASVKDWRMAVPLFTDLATREGFAARLRLLKRVIEKHYAARRKFLIPLLTIPRLLGGVGYRDAEPLKRRFELLDSAEIHPWLYYLAARVRKSLLLRNESFPQHLVDDCPNESMRYHPLVEAAQDFSSLERNLFQYGVVPSVEEIARDLVMDGIGRYEKYLPITQFVAPHSPWQTKETEALNRLERDSWCMALRKKHYFTTERNRITTLLSIAGDSDSPLAALNAYEEADTLAARQYSTLATYLQRESSTSITET